MGDERIGWPTRIVRFYLTSQSRCIIFEEFFVHELNSWFNVLDLEGAVTC